MHCVNSYCSSEIVATTSPTSIADGPGMDCELDNYPHRRRKHVYSPDKENNKDLAYETTLTRRKSFTFNQLCHASEDCSFSFTIDDHEDSFDSDDDEDDCDRPLNHFAETDAPQQEIIPNTVETEATKANPTLEHYIYSIRHTIAESHTKCLFIRAEMALRKRQIRDLEKAIDEDSERLNSGQLRDFNEFFALKNTFDNNVLRVERYREILKELVEKYQWVNIEIRAQQEEITRVGGGSFTC